MECAEVRAAIPAYVEDVSPSLAVRRHLSRCADCKDELARYETIATSLRQLRSVSYDAPAGLAPALAAIPDQESRLDVMRSHLVRNRSAYLGGAAAMVLAGAA